MNLIPATGNGVNHGVLVVKLDKNISGMSWGVVADMTAQRLRSLNVQYDNRIFLMPDNVQFGGAAAWAHVGGSTFYVLNQFAKFPIVQVHEFGHLLGARHSGANGNGYSDKSCYMGNQVPWNDQGAYMCFNAAKTWHFGWFKQQHIQINPTGTPFNGYLAGIDDAVTGKAGSSKVVVRIKGSNAQEQEFYLMFNRAKGINRGAIGGRDQVVITSQKGESADSNHIAALGSGQEWKYANYDRSGRSLVVKNCFRNGDKAKVLIYIQGKNNQSCGSPPSGGNNGGNSGGNSGGDNGNGGSCTDVSGWHDIGGSKFNCGWYGSNPNYCSLYGGRYENDGFTANQACCVCGGGQ